MTFDLGNKSETVYLLLFKSPFTGRTYIKPMSRDKEKIDKLCWELMEDALERRDPVDHNYYVDECEYSLDE